MSKPPVTLHPCVCGPNSPCPLSCPHRPRKRRASPEAQIQRAIIGRLRLHGVLCIAIPNEGRRSPAEAQRMKARGMRPGVPDLLCVQHGRAWFLEVKAPRGRLSPAQVECHAELGRHAFPPTVVTSQDEAVDALRAAGFTL